WIKTHDKGGPWFYEGKRAKITPLFPEALGQGRKEQVGLAQPILDAVRAFMRVLLKVRFADGSSYAFVER
ncbi:MAG: hypothetical protein QXZ09_10135, partial [Candidatus Methanomethylicaceae archaeon]